MKWDHSPSMIQGFMRWLMVPFLFACSNESPVSNANSIEQTTIEHTETTPSTKDSVDEKTHGRVSPNDITVAVQDLERLQSLEKTHSFDRLLPNSTTLQPTVDRHSTKWLYNNHDGYRMIAEHIQGRIDDISNEIQRDLIIELKDALKYPAGNVGRRLDNRWFESDISFFELIGVVNRLDKKDFYGGCGEVRFIYRLAYQDESGASSRLPLTFNLVMENTEIDCQKVARKWVRGESEFCMFLTIFCQFWASCDQVGR